VKAGLPIQQNNLWMGMEKKNFGKKRDVHFSSSVIRSYSVRNKFAFSTARVVNGTMNLHLKKTFSI